MPGDPLVRIAVLGASGYTGAELLRLLAGHPGVEVAALGADQAAGQSVGELYPHLVPFAGRRYERLAPDEVTARAEAAFLALPHGESMRVVPALVEGGLRVVDLAGDFRLAAEDYPSWYGFEHADPAWLAKAVYGLPELFAEDIREASLVASPGCYPTAAVLALAPLLRDGLVRPEGLVVDAKSGVSGAGRTPSPATHFAQADGSVRPYKAGVHQHTPELERALARVAGGPVRVTFVPHLVPATRGIVCTCYARLARPVSAEDLGASLHRAYRDAPFVRVLAPGQLPDSKRVTASNWAEVGAAVDLRTGTAIAVGSVDNLVKGAAGQAVQCFNLMFGFPEDTGLRSLAVYP